MLMWFARLVNGTTLMHVTLKIRLPMGARLALPTRAKLQSSLLKKIVLALIAVVKHVQPMCVSIQITMTPVFAKLMITMMVPDFLFPTRKKRKALRTFTIQVSGFSEKIIRFSLHIGM